MMRQSSGESVNDNEKVSKGDEETNLSQRLPLMAMKNWHEGRKKEKFSYKTNMEQIVNNAERCHNFQNIK